MQLVCAHAKLHLLTCHSHTNFAEWLCEVAKRNTPQKRYKNTEEYDRRMQSDGTLQFEPQSAAAPPAQTVYTTPSLVLENQKNWENQPKFAIVVVLHCILWRWSCKVEGLNCFLFTALELYFFWDNTSSSPWG